jgi:putative ABC transport system permease protein
MSDLLYDLRYAFRSLGNSPGFSVVAVVTLALGIGANSAVFSLINAVLLRPLPYEQPDRLVLVWESAPFFGLRDSPVAPANYADWKARSSSFEEMGAVEDCVYRLTGETSPELIYGSLVTASFLRALRIRPVAGRIFRDDEDHPGAPKVAILSDSFCRRRFGNTSVLGKTMVLNDEKHTIVGVLATGAEPPSNYRSTPGEIWTPLGSAYSAQELANRGRHNWMVAARLRAGTQLAEADAEMAAIGASLSREFPDTNAKVGAFVASMRDHFTDSSRRILMILLGAVTCVLLIACSNLANLLLSRAADRRKEVSVRAALGASARQLVRQFLAESLLLCLAGSALGLLLAAQVLEFLAHLAPGRLTGLNNLSLDWRVLAFTMAMAVLTTVVFALIPLGLIRRLDLTSALKQSARTLAAGSGSRRIRAVLISSEVALAFMLLIGAALLVQTLTRLRAVETGFRTDHILALGVPRYGKQAQPGERVAWQREVLRRVRAIPGVVSAGFTNHIPLVVKGDISGIGAEGRGEKERFQCRSRVAGPGYLKTMGIALRRGRDIEERDDDRAPRVVLINETLARTLWPDQDPIGRRIHFGSDLSVPVVGVVADIHQAGLHVPPAPEFYISALQAPFFPASLAIRTAVDPTSLASAVRAAIWAVDPDQPVTAVATMEEILDRELFQRRVQTLLLGGFAGLALLLASIGIYGVLAHLVGRQVPEIGLRIALGATRVNVLGRVVGQSLLLAGFGILVGVAGALGVSRLLASLLYGVKATDPVTYAVVAIALLLTAAVAGFVPARRAMRVDPIVALREE